MIHFPFQNKKQTMDSPAISGITSVKVLGAGCNTCHTQFENVKKAMKRMGMSLVPEYITDMEKISGYGVLRFPAICLNDTLAVQGELLSPKEVERLFLQFGEKR